MASPVFYFPSLQRGVITLDENTSRHIAGVLRMGKNAVVLLTDGKGQSAKAILIDNNKKKCLVQVTAIEQTIAPGKEITIGISLVKNASRFEWFLEKATEVGVTSIIPLLCERTEKEKFRFDRLNNILVSAMIQSQQTWLPVLHEPQSYKQVVEQATQENKFIAHCTDDEKTSLSSTASPGSSSIILIGPEGDFTPEEIQMALQKSFIPVSLGHTRLRTETAGIVAAVLLQNR